MGRDGVVDNESTLQVCAHHAGQWCGGVLVLLGLYILSRLVFSRPLSLSGPEWSTNQLHLLAVPVDHKPDALSKELIERTWHKHN